MYAQEDCQEIARKSVVRAITLHEMQQIEFELLCAIDNLCRHRGLRYYMDGGTLLGAMCYEGFIPWDDDIDLKMPRPDYKKFLTLSTELPDHIEILAPSAAQDGYLFAKLIDLRTDLVEHTCFGERHIGVYIDILPMDGWPEGDAEAQRHIKKLRRMNAFYHAEKTGFGKGAKGTVKKLIYGSGRAFYRLNALAQKYPYDEASHVGLMIEGDPYRERFDKEWLEPAVELEFMGRKFPAPNAYEHHLQVFYGNHISKSSCYHNLPKIESTHDYEAYWKD